MRAIDGQYNGFHFRLAVLFVREEKGRIFCTIVISKTTVGLDIYSLVFSFTSSSTFVSLSVFFN